MAVFYLNFKKSKTGVRNALSLSRGEGTKSLQGSTTAALCTQDPGTLATQHHLFSYKDSSVPQKKSNYSSSTSLKAERAQHISGLQSWTPPTDFCSSELWRKGRQLFSISSSCLYTGKIIAAHAQNRRKRSSKEKKITQFSNYETRQILC